MYFANLVFSFISSTTPRLSTHYYTHYPLLSQLYCASDEFVLLHPHIIHCTITSTTTTVTYNINYTHIVALRPIRDSSRKELPL